ncbi:MAG TPA: hypothetical protein ENN73_05345 [Firmicutes bacterium]|nr:hypothetical protein [Bacillota bacterium]
MTQPGAYAKNISLVHIHLRKGDKWRITGIGSELISMQDIKRDEDLFNILKPYFDKTKEFSETPLTVIDKDLNTLHSYFKDCAVVDLIHQVQLKETGADISVAALFNPSLQLAKGDITIADIAGIYKYENFLYVRELTGKQVKNYLEFCATFFNGTESFSEGIISDKLKGYNYDTLEGVNYEIDLSKPEGERILNLTESSTSLPVNPDKVYKVAMNNYRSNGGGGHLKASNAETTPIVYRSNQPVRDLIINYLSDGNLFLTSPTGNWKIVQEDEVIKIAERNLDKIKNMR